MAKMTKDNGPVFVLAAFLLLAGQTVGEIHRAKAIKAKPPARPRTDFFADSENGVVNKQPYNNMDIVGQVTEEVFFTENRKEAWIYSLCCSVLVGLSGIFPLLVIPIEAGPALQHGSAAKKLKLLLSFAVGGLLGDVFLHLLPEAWAHANSGGGHDDHTEIGLWVLTGILTFLILEKIFAEEDEFDLLESEDEPVKTTTKTLTPTNSLRRRTSSLNKLQNGDINFNKVVQNGSAVGTTTSKETEKVPRIKISGYLNLMANCIDNFTHGLAVAGSFLVSPKVGALTTFAILIHEIPHEVGDFAILLKSGFDRWKAARAQLATASGGILGAIFALSADSAKAAVIALLTVLEYIACRPLGSLSLAVVLPETECSAYLPKGNIKMAYVDHWSSLFVGEQTAWILPFTSGGFLYIALVTVVPDLLNEKQPKESVKQILCLLAGILAMLIVTWFVE